MSSPKTRKRSITEATDSGKNGNELIKKGRVSNAGAVPEVKTVTKRGTPKIVATEKSTRPSSGRRNSNEVTVKPTREKRSYLNFYRNEIKFAPDGDTINNIHTWWWHDFAKLNNNDEYAEWLFPIRKEKAGFQFMELTLPERKAMKNDEAVMKRILNSYRMMLHFYGMLLIDSESGDLVRGRKWKEQSDHLNRSPHLYPRITRMLKSLGEFDCEYLKKGFLQFMANEIFVNGSLKNCVGYFKTNWVTTLVSEEDQDEVLWI